MQIGHGHRRGTDRREVELSGIQIEAGQPENAVMHDRVGVIEDRDALARVAESLLHAAQAEILHGRRVGLLQLNSLHHAEIVGLQNRDGRAELVEIFAIGRNFEAAAAAASTAATATPSGTGRSHIFPSVAVRAGWSTVFTIFCCARSMMVYFGLPMFVAVRQLGDLRGGRCRALALRVRRAAVEAVPVRRVVEHEVIGHLVGGHVDHFDAAVIVGGDIDRLADRATGACWWAGRFPAESGRSPCPVDFVDHQHPIRIGAAEERACAARRHAKRQCAIRCFIVEFP